jgi:hypothetical protein
MFFQKILEFANAINICYKRQSLQLQSKAQCGKTWVVVSVVIKIPNLVVKHCVFNQIWKFWLLSNALQPTLTIRVKFQVDVDCIIIIEPLLQCGNCDLKLEILYSCMATEVLKILSPFLFFA